MVPLQQNDFENLGAIYGKHWPYSNDSRTPQRSGKSIKSGISYFNFAEINLDECSACGVCADERCQVNAIEEDGDIYRVITKKCIGCGLCTTTCPVGAISLIRKSADQIQAPPDDEMEWYKKRAQLLGMDINKYT